MKKNDKNFELFQEQFSNFNFLKDVEGISSEFFIKEFQLLDFKKLTEISSEKILALFFERNNFKICFAIKNIDFELRKIFLELFSKKEILNFAKIKKEKTDSEILSSPEFLEIHSAMISTIEKFWAEKKIDEKIDKMENPNSNFLKIKFLAEKIWVRVRIFLLIFFEKK